MKKLARPQSPPQPGDTSIPLMAVEDRIPKELKSFPVGLCAPVGGAPAYQAAAWLRGPGAHAKFY